MGDDGHPNADEKTCILWQNEDHTVTLLDIPRSLELAQQFEHLSERKLWSSLPLEQPYPSLEPKSRKALAALKSPDINDLILHRVLTLALEEVGEEAGKNDDSLAWCLPRSCYYEKQSSLQDERPGKRHHIIHDATVSNNDATAPPLPYSVPSDQLGNSQGGDSDFLPSSPSPLFNNTLGRTITITLPGSNSPAIVPVNSTYIHGEITSTLPIFTQNAPQFPLIILDPPWPNRSARRAGCYQTSYGLSEISTLLSSIPVGTKLEKNGLVGVWVTNKESFQDLLLGKDGEGGLFEEWGIELVEEWVWLKVTASGEPMSPIGGTWRKPFEILLVGRKISTEEINMDPCEVGSKTEVGEVSDERKGGKGIGISEEQPCVRPTPVKRRVIIAVPDMHSRKPNLLAVFEPLLPCSSIPPHCLEIFARNLTAHSWAWGDEVLKFQRLEHWTECTNKN
ncbi:hypothetical protein V496_00185 [Pseudogymnoascus sp. VKM F-4515 (FW-2607)]|nr:hypothetical protein V496_00185 [Pseudogymnoascus sp. VKM F-4515 (FW-2607)]KFY99586.1 hypothetical protein V498_00653 [Pseudogymnoascus sp. VKM F-4517 (FW-2822)]